MSDDYVKLWYWLIENHPDIHDKFEQEIYGEGLNEYRERMVKSYLF